MSEPTQFKQPDSFRYFVNGKERERDEAVEYPIQVVGPEPGGISAFDDAKPFEAWAATTEFAEKFEAGRALIARVQSLRETDLTRVERVQQKRVAYLTEALEELASQMDLPVGSDELLARASISPDPVEGPIFDPMVLWDQPCGGPDCYGSGRWIPVANWVPLPDFRWFGFNDRASHVWCAGLGAICEHIWFEGRWVWIAGYWTHFDLVNVAFDNTASSAWVI